MATDKKSFVLYGDLIYSIDHLTNEEKGILFTHLLEYVNDKKPVLEDRLILTAWKPIERQLKRDLIKFEEVKSKRSEAGKESARVRALNKAKDESTNPTSVESVKQVSTNPTVSVNENVNDNGNEIKKEKKEAFNFRKSLINLGFEESLVTDWLKVRKNKKASNTQTAFSAIENQVNFSDASINDVLKMHVEKSWSGFKIKWYENEKQNSQQNGKQISGTKQAATYNRSRAINEIQTKFGNGD